MCWVHCGPKRNSLTQKHIYTHKETHSHKNIFTQRETHSHRNTFTQRETHSHKNTFTHTQGNSLTQKHIYTQRNSLTQKHIYTQRKSLTQKHIYTQRNSLTQKHNYTEKHTHTKTHLHTEKHTHCYSRPPSPSYRHQFIHTPHETRKTHSLHRSPLHLAAARRGTPPSHRIHEEFLPRAPNVHRQRSCAVMVHFSTRNESWFDLHLCVALLGTLDCLGSFSWAYLPRLTVRSRSLGIQVPSALCLGRHSCLKMFCLEIRERYKGRDQELLTGSIRTRSAEDLLSTLHTRRRMPIVFLSLAVVFSRENNRWSSDQNSCMSICWQKYTMWRDDLGGIYVWFYTKKQTRVISLSLSLSLSRPLSRVSSSQRSVWQLRGGACNMKHLCSAGTKYARGIFLLRPSMVQHAPTTSRHLCKYHFGVGDVEGVMWRGGTLIILLKGRTGRDNTHTHTYIWSLWWWRHISNPDLRGIACQYTDPNLPLTGCAPKMQRPNSEIRANSSAKTQTK